MKQSFGKIIKRKSRYSKSIEGQTERVISSLKQSIMKESELGKTMYVSTKDHLLSHLNVNLDREKVWHNVLEWLTKEGLTYKEWINPYNSSITNFDIFWNDI